ncbi:DUF4239 domain-containing protein [Aquibium sp. A9E412]|uniref:bestrophin-like domain n=1 Tax=Aquibium sp. A9E412 TaxID=2976767 RepID=UPI0025AFF43D|nr:DUF4239 domain-containing protein [Aquibium sp. A9E412]MDN2564915.1 DUF4239 domain-containing protein [Aquibium sp. A9E412]
MVHSLALGVVFVFGTIALAWLSYFGMRALTSGWVESETRELAGSVIFRVAALHGLILALVFAQEMIDYQELRSSLVEEATAVADIYNDIRRYGGDAVEPMQSALSAYVRVVVDEEWDRLARDTHLAPEAWSLRETVYLAVLDLEPQTAREEALRNHMLAKIQKIAELRQKRENTALQAISSMFWFAAVAGVVLITLPYFIFPPSPLNLMLLSVYGAFTGIVMLFIYAFSDPFSPPGNLAPAAFERLLETEIGGAATQ